MSLLRYEYLRIMIFFILIFYRGILNVHGSLLPKLRGAAPIARAIIQGEKETGISIMKIAPHK
jgi:methionyl-tRNA formyltransferase